MQGLDRDGDHQVRRLRTAADSGGQIGHLRARVIRIRITHDIGRASTLSFQPWSDPT